MIYVEDYLENLVGLSGTKKYNLERSDATFLSSIARQVFKGVGLTDRQHNAVKEKLIKYKDQFETFDEDSLDHFRIPLRQIDRSQYITIVDSESLELGSVFSTETSKSKWIKIRFPFNKKTITVIESLKFKLVGSYNQRSMYSNGYYHKKGSHEHYFKLTEQTAYSIVDNFKEKNFNIDNDLVDYYNRVKVIADNPQQYVPGIYNFNLENIVQSTKDVLINELGEINNSTLALYKDRSLLYDLRHFDDDDLSKSIKNFSLLSQKIINRKNNLLFVNKNEWLVDSLLESILELNRFPLLVMLDEEHAIDQLSTIHQHLRNIINNTDTSVMFRLDNNEDEKIAFNQYVKDNKLNNLVDKNTKVVYISKSKLPKPLMRTGWKPNCVLSPSSIRTTAKTDVYENECDLAIHYDTQLSPYYEYRKGEGKIEKI